jgi:hypothetical protein
MVNVQLSMPSTKRQRKSRWQAHFDPGNGGDMFLRNGEFQLTTRRYRAGRPRFVSRQCKIFLFFKASKHSEAHPMNARGSLPEKKATGAWSWPFTPSNGGAIHPLYIFMEQCLTDYEQGQIHLLRAIISQKTEDSTITAVRTSNPTHCTFLLTVVSGRGKKAQGMVTGQKKCPWQLIL